jgi:dTDP-L-rhamnose 4-epimerase
MQILITGGAGFIGRSLVQSLLPQGHTIRVLDNLSEQVHGADASVPDELREVEFVYGDVCDPEAVKKAVQGSDAVVHLAAETGVGQSMYEITRYVMTNDAGTANVLQAIIEAERPLQRLVLASSRAIYGEGLYACAACGRVSPAGRAPADLEQARWEPVCPTCGAAITPLPTSEDAPPNPQSIYAVNKLTQEHLCRTVGQAYQIPTIILRYFNVYGPGQSLSNPYTGILSTFYARIQNGGSINVFEDGQESRDFVYIDDVVAATHKALCVPFDSLPTTTFNVGTGTALSIQELAETVVAASGTATPIACSGAYRIGDIRHAFADTRQAAQHLGFTAQTPLQEGIARWMEWANGCAAQNRTDMAQQELARHKLYRTAEQQVK